MKLGNKATKISRFTLIEVVIVLVIILVLSALILPFLARRRDRAIKEACKQNLKQIGLALSMYSGNYGYPPGEAFPHKNGRAGLQMLAEVGFIDTTATYVCPNTGDTVSDMTKVSQNASYAYAGGLTEANSCDSATTADRANNHNQYGNILFVDRSIKGYSGVNWSSNRGGSDFGDFK